MDLQVPPEPRPQCAREAFHAGVVQRGLAFPQIVHQHVPDRTAGQTVPVDQFLGCPRPSGAAYLPQRGRRVRAEDAHGTHKPVEHRGVTGHRGERADLDIRQLQDIAYSDLSQRAALGREDLSGAIEGVAARHRAHVRVHLA